MNKKIRTFALLLAACLLLTTASPMLPMTEGSSTVVEAASKAKKITVKKKGDGLFLQIGKKKKASGFFKLVQKVTSKDGKIRVGKGIYYLYKGQIYNYQAGKASKAVTKLDKKGRVLSKKKYMLNIKDLTINNTDGIIRVSSSTSLFSGSFNGVDYKKGKAVKKNASSSSAAELSAGAEVKKDSSAQAEVQAGKQVVDLIYYKNGQAQTNYTGWVKTNDSLYYINNGTALSNGYYTVKGYDCESRAYTYAFGKDGRVITNFYGLSRKYYKMYLKKKIKFEINLSSHTFTILMKNPKTGRFDIPLKSFVCATSRHYNGTPTGTYTLNKGFHLRWFIYRRSNPYHYYQWAVKVGHTNILIHSNMYYSTNNRRLVKKYYNLFGHNITTHCIRVQAVNAKMIYQIACKNKHKIKVQVYRSEANPGPFGEITLDDTTGKTNKNYDPTDPNIVKNSYKYY